MNVVYCVCYKDMKLKEWEIKWKTWYPYRYLVLNRVFWVWERKNFCGDRVDLSESFHPYVLLSIFRQCLMANTKNC